MVLACVNKACFIFLQAVGKALASTLLSMFREVVFGVGFALLLPVFFGLDGVLYSMPVSDVLTFRHLGGHHRENLPGTECVKPEKALSHQAVRQRLF